MLVGLIGQFRKLTKPQVDDWVEIQVNYIAGVVKACEDGDRKHELLVAPMQNWYRYHFKKEDDDE